MKRLELFGLEGIAEVNAGDSIGALICDVCARQGIELADDDVFVVAQKVISKAEGRMVRLDDVKPSARARQLAQELDKEAELVEVILGESRKVIRTGGRALIVETHHGFVCANAGVDQSNVGLGQVALLPKDADHSAREIRREIQTRTGKSVGVIISDSFGRAWRVGTADVAVGVDVSLRYDHTAVVVAHAREDGTVAVQAKVWEPTPDLKMDAGAVKAHIRQLART